MAINRPPIVTASYQEPFPGWTDTPSGIGVLTVPSVLGWRREFSGDPDALLDIMPVDINVN